MIATRTSLQRIGWAALIGLCCALLFGLSLKVNALKSEVRLAERRLVALKRETIYLETEYETRSNQQQLAAWNAVDFGYAAPGPGQYFENERQLALLGKPAAPDAPEPIRVAMASEEPPTGLIPEMVSPLTGKPLGEEDEPKAAEAERLATATGLSEHLARSDRDERQKSPKNDDPTKPGSDRAAATEKRP